MSPWPSPEVRFWQKVEKRNDGCWQWIGGTKAAGYGQFAVNGKKVIAHRWSYEFFVGPIGDGLEIDHLCRNPSCVRPDHLEPITIAENRARRVAAKTSCIHGHAYTPENTIYQMDKQGYQNRYCRACNLLKQRRTYANRKPRD